MPSNPPSQNTPRSQALSVKWPVWTVVFILLAIVITFTGLRLVIDIPWIIAGQSPPPDSFEAHYIEHPVSAYLHIIPGVLFLLGALFQLSRKFRERHWKLHKKMGPYVAGAGLLSGVFALLFGIPNAFGGTGEAAATAVFGVWFILSLLLAIRSIKRGKVSQHRQWMIRAFAVGLSVGSIRILIGLFEAAALMSFQQSFVPAFWIGLGTHALAAEIWLWWRPDPR